jgi:inner membrane protein
MKNQTHLLFAILFGIIYFEYSYIPTQKTAILFSIGLLGGYLLPDIDEPKSTLSQKIPIIPSIIALFTKHRGLFHTLWIPILLYGASYILPLPYIFTGLAIGYVSHLTADMLTVSGIRPFYPLTRLKIKGRVKTGSFLEKILFLAILAYILLAI